MSAWADYVRQVHDQAKGFLTLEVVRRDDVPALMLRALAGEEDAPKVLQLVNGALNNIRSAPRRRPMLCASCPRPVRNGSEFAIVVAFPDGAGATAGIGLAICDRCGTTHNAIRARALDALRRIWPDGREVRVTHAAGGHA